MNILKANLSFISLNTRGLKDNVKRKAIFLYCKGQKAHYVFLQETHSCTTDATSWTSQWGDKVLFSHGTSKSAGVAICFNRCPGNVTTHKAVENGHWLAAVLNIEGSFMILINIYGYNNTNQNERMLAEISDVITEYRNVYNTSLILLGGDFNMAPDDWLDRCPSKFNSNHYNTTLFDFCNTHSLIDVWRNKNMNNRQFSWIKPNGSARSRIDLWLLTTELERFVSKVSMSNAPLTDHCLITLTVQPSLNQNKRNTHWKFNADLLKCDEYCNLIKDLRSEVKFDTSIGSYCNRWEFFKFRVRQISIKFGKKRSKEIREQELKLVQEIDECCRKTPMLSLTKICL